ncbi:MAG: hypothetical protein K6C95_02455 [Lachnospiraceae bacterium]|nr:hypothetical protein [Lachnospiraceae bacterium]
MTGQSGKRHVYKLISAAVAALFALSACSAKDLDVIYDLSQQDQKDEYYSLIQGDDDGNGSLVLLGPMFEPLPKDDSTAEDEKPEKEDKEDRKEEETEEKQPEQADPPKDEGITASDVEKPQEPMELETDQRSREDIEREDQEKRSAIGLTEDRIQSIMSENTGRYYYDHIDGDGKRLYAELYHITVARGEKIKVSSLDEKTVDTVFQYMMADHPEIFYADGYTYTRYTIGDELIKLGFTARYLCDPAEEKRRSDAIESKVAEIVAGAPGGDDQYAKAKYVYERVVDMTEYEVGSPDNQNICSVFINGRSVCQGYAKAAQLLLNRLGVKTTLVTGTVSAGDRPQARHAWNLTNVNGRDYFFDVTWGDSSFQQAASEETLNRRINYDYLLDTTRDLADTHSFDDLVPIPECTHLEDNYYVREGAYFTAFNADQMSALFEKAYNSGAETVTVKCADDTAYGEITGVLITDRSIFDYLKTSGNSASFATSDTQRTLTFVL